MPSLPLSVLVTVNAPENCEVLPIRIGRGCSYRLSSRHSGDEMRGEAARAGHARTNRYNSDLRRSRTDPPWVGEKLDRARGRRCKLPLTSVPLIFPAGPRTAEESVGDSWELFPPSYKAMPTPPLLKMELRLNVSLDRGGAEPINRDAFVGISGDDIARTAGRTADGVDLRVAEKRDAGK